jgi:predicted lipoprotein
LSFQPVYRIFTKQKKQIMNGDQKEFKSERPSNSQMHNHKEHSARKFTTFSEMKTHHNAIQTLYKNGYDKHALQHIAGQFQDSIQFVLVEVNRMRDNMSEIIQS